MIVGIGNRIKEARLALGLTQDELAKKIGVTKGAVANYENNVSHPKETVIYSLIGALGVDANFLFQDCVQTKKAPAISAEAMKVAKDYDELPYWGQHMVKTLIADVFEGVAAMAEQEPVDYESDGEPAALTRTVPLFRQSMAAGPAEPANEQIQMFDNYEIPIDSKADFAIRVNGTSAEPYLHDGQIALGINRQPGFGEVGAFQLDAEFLIKQVVSDHLGNIYLLSLNRAEEDKDVTIWAGADTRQLTYIGTIILDKKPPLPKI